MTIKRGIPVSGGYCIGRALLIDAEDTGVAKRRVPPEQVEHELQSVEQAFEKARAELAEQWAQFRAKLGDEVAEIFKAHDAILRDPKLRTSILESISSKNYSAGFAIHIVVKRLKRRFEAEPFLRDRVRDLVDVERRLLHHLGVQTRREIAAMQEPAIIVAHDLTPSQTASLERTHKVLGFACDLGGPTSHTAIIARGLGLPAVVGLDDITVRVNNGELLILDGTHGTVIVEPDEAQLAQYREHDARRTALIRSLAQLRDLPAQTTDGVTVELHANIEFPDEIDTCLNRGAAGIGLFRTEFLFMGEGPEPNEEQQVAVYRQVAERLGHARPLVIRTLDLGGDKFPHRRMTWEAEPNPFLGLRSIRYCLRHREVFSPQLRAILLASAHGDVRVMFPLISQVQELRLAKYMLRLAMEELEEDGFEINTRIKIGAMVETPSAAIRAAQLAEEVDFLSIGTNDLIQYTLAVDRSNERVADLYTPYDPSVLYLVNMVIQACRTHNKELSLCGEVAGDITATMLLLGMGLRKLSMPAANIPEVKKLIRSISMQAAQEVAARVLGFETDREVLNYLRERTREFVPEDF